MLKKIKPTISVFKYDPSNKELRLASDLVFYLNSDSLQFEIDQNPHGEAKPTPIFNASHNDDFSQFKFDCVYRRKPTTFLLSSDYACDKILYRLLANGVEKGFLDFKDESDESELVFEKGQIKALRLTKRSANYRITDSISILREENAFNLVLFNPWRKVKLNYFEMRDENIVSKTEDTEFIYKLNLQPLVLNTIKQLIKESL